MDGPPRRRKREGRTADRREGADLSNVQGKNVQGDVVVDFRGLT